MDRPTRAFFVYFLSSYVLLLLIGIVAFVVVSVQTRAQIQSRTDESIRLHLQRGKDLTEARLDEVISGAHFIARTRGIADFMWVSRPLEPRHYYALLHLSGEFEQFSLKSSFVDSVYLVFRESGAMLSTFYVSPDYEFIVRNFLRYEGQRFEEWLEWVNLWDDRVRLLPAARVHLHGRSVGALTLRVPLPVAAAEPRAALIALIPASSIAQHFQPLIDAGAIVSVRDHEDREVYSSMAVPVDTHRWAVTATDRGASRWGLSYHVALPHAYVRQQMFGARAVLNAIFVVTLFVGLAAAVFFALRNSRPLARLITLIDRIDAENPPGAKLDHAFTNVMERLVGREIDLERAVERRDDMLRSGFYERLLRGGFHAEEEVREYLASLGLSFADGPMRVILVTGLSYRETSPGPHTEALVHDYLRSRMPDEGHLYRTREGEALLVPDVPASLRALDAAFGDLDRATGIRIAAGVGAPRASLTGIAASFTEAGLALRTALRSRAGHEVHFYREDGEPYDLLEDDRRRLVGMVIAGDLDGLSELLGSIRDRNFRERSTSTPAREALFTDLRTVARQAYDTLGREADAFRAAFEGLGQYRSADDFFSRITELFVRLASTVVPGNDNRSNVNAGAAAIAAYLDRRYGDPHLCLSSVSTAFQINPQYLSRMFHEQMGESFSGYLERVRMTAAGRAIEGGREPLKAVALESGFSSWNSFYKAFRRYYGVSPSGYRVAFMRNTAR